MTDILTLARENGFSHIGFADMAALTPLEEVRKMCSADRCGQWNTNWSCPPACGSIEHAKRRIAQYNKCLLVQTSGELADEFDYDGMQSTAKAHKRAFLNFARQARILYPGCLPLTAGACTICKKCTYPNKPCPIPVKTSVVNGGFRPFCKRCMLPFGTWIQLRSAHDDLHLVPSVF